MAADFNRCVYFLTVCEWGSIAKAAEKLYITPQALNRQIRLLESELGQPLFTRTARKLELTAFGRFFREQMQPVHHLYLSACREVERFSGSSAPKIKLGFFQGLPKKRVVLPIVEELIARRPELEIDLLSADMEAIYRELRERKTDIALSYVSPADHISDLETIHLLELRCSIVISPLHPWAGRKTVTAEDMASFPVLFLARENGPDTEGFYADLKASSYHFAKDSIAMAAQLGLGQHYAVFPTTFENLSESGLLTLPLPENMDAAFSLALVYRPDSPWAQFFSELNFLQSSMWKKFAIDENDRYVSSK